MPDLTQHSSGDYARILYCGNSGSGKTGSLTSLVAAGYHLRIIDMDNGLDALRNFVLAECPQNMGNVGFVTKKDRYKTGQMGPQVKGTPKAFVDACKLLDVWEDGTDPSTWGPDHILVIDSLTAMGKACFEFIKAGNPGVKEPRQWYNQAQQLLDNVIDGVTSDDMKTNVIVCTHIDYREENNQTKGFASSIGKALGPKIPRYFNTMIQAESKTMGKTTKRVIRTIPSFEIDLKNPAPMRVQAEYPLETGMAKLFEDLKGV